MTYSSSSDSGFTFTIPPSLVGTKVKFKGKSADFANEPKDRSVLGVIEQAGFEFGSGKQVYKVRWSKKELYWHAEKNIKLLIERDPITITDSYV